ncbi:hypothetical protein Ancab_001499 [Ancistrocladus abbreviatus]
MAPTTIWTRKDDEKFESAVFHYQSGPSARENIAANAPGKFMADVKQHHSGVITTEVDLIESLLGAEGLTNGGGEKEREQQQQQHYCRKSIRWTEDEHRYYALITCI